VILQRKLMHRGPVFVRSTIQSFCNAVHPFCRANPQVALFFRAVDGRIALPACAMISHYYAGVPRKGSHRSGERLYSLSPLLSLPFGDRLVTGGPRPLAERVACRYRLPVNRANERLSIAFVLRSTEFLQRQLSP